MNDILVDVSFINIHMCDPFRHAVSEHNFLNKANNTFDVKMQRVFIRRYFRAPATNLEMVESPSIQKIER